MHRSLWTILVITGLLIAGVFIAGCSDNTATTASPSPSAAIATPATSGALYSAGDIVKNPKSSSGAALLIIRYDAATDMYERAYVYPNTDGSFGYRLDSKTDLISRSVIEKLYTAKVKSTDVTAIPIKTLTVAPTATVISATTTASTGTTTVTTTATTWLAPRITNIDPDKGKTGTTVSITNLEGQNFHVGASVVLKKAGTIINATDVSVSSANLVTCKFAIPVGATTGYWDVVLTNTDGQYHQYQNGFLVQEGTETATTTTTYTASSGLVKITQVQDPLLVTGGGEAYKTVSILGTNLTAASGMKLTGPSTITASTYSSGSSTTAIGYFTIPSGNIGTYYVNVVDSSGNILATSTSTLTIQ
jgi:hypothetical protein